MFTARAITRDAHASSLVAKSVPPPCGFCFVNPAAVVSHSPWREDGTTRSKVWEYFLCQWSTGDGPVMLLAQGVW